MSVDDVLLSLSGRMVKSHIRGSQRVRACGLGERLRLSRHFTSETIMSHDMGMFSVLYRYDGDWGSNHGVNLLSSFTPMSRSSGPAREREGASRPRQV